MLMVCPPSTLEAARDTLSKGTRSLWDVKIGKTKPSDTFSKALAHYTIGVIYDNEGKVAEALAEYKKALELDPKISYLHTRLGVDCFLTKDVDGAVDEFKAAKILDPLDTKPRFLLALAYTEQKKLDLARKEYESIVRINEEWKVRA